MIGRKNMILKAVKMLFVVLHDAFLCSKYSYSLLFAKDWSCLLGEIVLNYYLIVSLSFQWLGFLYKYRVFFLLWNQPSTTVK